MLTPNAFHDLPELLADRFKNLPPGSRVALVTLEHTPAENREPLSFVMAVVYEHESFEYRTPGEKDAVAHGTGTVGGNPTQRKVRILFSKLNRTATIRGLPFGGQVKLNPRGDL